MATPEELARIRAMKTGKEKRTTPFDRWKEKNTRKTAIDAKCYDCTCASIVEIRECPMTDCPLYEWRPYK